MRKPSESFLGTVAGLMLVLLAPSNYLHSEWDIIRWLVVFPGLGAAVGTIIGIVRRRHSADT